MADFEPNHETLPFRQGQVRNDVFVDNRPRSTKALNQSDCPFSLVGEIDAHGNLLHSETHKSKFDKVVPFIGMISNDSRPALKKKSKE